MQTGGREGSSGPAEGEGPAGGQGRAGAGLAGPGPLRGHAPVHTRLHAATATCHQAAGPPARALLDPPLGGARASAAHRAAALRDLRGEGVFLSLGTAAGMTEMVLCPQGLQAPRGACRPLPGPSRPIGDTRPGATGNRAVSHRAAGQEGAAPTRPRPWGPADSDAGCRHLVLPRPGQVPGRRGPLPPHAPGAATAGPGRGPARRPLQLRPLMKAGGRRLVSGDQAPSCNYSFSLCLLFW